MDTEWIVGRKEIMAALHKDSWSSVRRWKKKYGVEFVTWPNGQPAILRVVLNKYLMRASKATQGKHPLVTRNLLPYRGIVEA